MAKTQFSGPVIVSNPFTVATVPSATGVNTGGMIFVTNGANGSAIIAFSDGTDWLRVDTRGVISAT